MYVYNFTVLRCNKITKGLSSSAVGKVDVLSYCSIQKNFVTCMIEGPLDII